MFITLKKLSFRNFKVQSNFDTFHFLKPFKNPTKMTHISIDEAFSTFKTH